MTIRATVGPSQTMPDIAIQYCGSIAAWPELAKLNGLSMTDQVTPGTSLILPEVVDKSIVSYFKEKGYKPATDFTYDNLEGIDYWQVFNQFEVQ